MKTKNPHQANDEGFVNNAARHSNIEAHNITTDEFLSTVFQKMDNESERIAIGLLKKGGKGIPCTPHQPNKQLSNPIRTDSTLYFSIAGFVDPKMRAGHISRKKDNFRSAYVIICDDIGQKKNKDGELVVPKSKEMPEPSYKLETSPDNFQYGYLLNEPFKDYDTVKHLMKCIAQNGYSDKGFSSPIHLARMPGSYNLKKDFVSKLTEWNPERRFSKAQIREMFGITDDAPVKKTYSEPAYEKSDDVLKWLGKHGHLMGNVSDDWHGVTCPRADEHTKDTGEGQAAYSPSRRAFNCFHSHEVYTSDFYKWVKEQGGPDHREMMVDVQGAEVLRICDLMPALSIFNLPDLIKTRKGNPCMSQRTTNHNLKSIADHAKILIRYDMMAKDILLRHKEDHTLNYQIVLGRFFEICESVGINSRQRIQQNLLGLAQLDRFHPMEEWILQTRWDGKDYFTQLLDTIELNNVNSQQLFSVYLKKWLVQCVEAVRGWRAEVPQPVPHVLVLAGPSGCGKSRWVKSLTPPQFFQGEQSLYLNAINQRDAVMQATRKPVIELAELDQSLRGSDWAALKSFLTAPEDVYRAPYAAREEAHPRMTSFFGSVNGTSFIKELEGARRIWPVNVKQCNADHDIDIGLLWAQMNHIWETGEEPLFLSPAQEAIRANELEYYMASSQVRELLEEFFDIKKTRELIYIEGEKMGEKRVNTLPMTARASKNNAQVLTASQILRKLERKFGKIERQKFTLINEVSTQLHALIGPKQKIFNRQNCWALIEHKESSGLQLVKKDGGLKG
jgi:predicted P-loop ATPase